MTDIEADELTRVAEDDISAARTLLSIGPPLLTIAAYHAQQAGEKAVKAALRKLGIEYAKTHDIGVNAARLPKGHPFAVHATKLSVATPWATQPRFTTTTPPAAHEIEQALNDAQSLTVEIAQTFPSPASALATGLAATTPEKWRSKRLLGLWVDPGLIADASASPTSSDADAVVAFRIIAETSAHQPEYDLKRKTVTPTGRFLYGWHGVRHVQDLMLSGSKTSPKARLYFNALQLEEAVDAHPGMTTAFAALLKVHRGHEPPENLFPEQGMDGRS